MKSPEDLFSYLSTLSIKTVTAWHEPLFTCEQARVIYDKIAGGHCKNLFLMDAAKRL